MPYLLLYQILQVHFDETAKILIKVAHIFWFCDIQLGKLFSVISQTQYNTSKDAEFHILSNSELQF